MTKFEDLPLTKDGVLDATKLDKIEFPIEIPIKRGIKGENIKSTTVREPCLADIEASQAETTGLKETMTLISLVADNLSPDCIAKLKPRDYTRIMTVLQPFLA